MPISHRLPIYKAAFRFYDGLPLRLSNFLREKYGYLSLIDVGANIGDTILFCFNNQDDKFIAIEPNPHFTKYLRKSCNGIKNFRM